MIKKIILLLFSVSLLSFSQSPKLPTRFIQAFDLEPNDLELSRLAQPYQYFDKIGRRAGLMGYESGSFEMWVWPWKPLRNFELQFLLGSSTQPIVAKDIVRTISVTPEVTTLTYTHESFSVREHILIPRNEPGAIILLDVHTTSIISIISSFIPVMQPMWPAGVGGQFSYWDDEINGYVISEGQWRAEFICGSPAGQQMAAPPAHMFADNPLQFRIDVKPGETVGQFIPIVIAGARPDTSTWKMSMDSVKATYTRLWKNAGKYYRESYDYYQNLRSSTMQVTTPDKEFNLAYEWGKISLDNLMIENPRLGYGMAAGFGLSGGGARPGFAWFFGGDAFINVLTMNSVGMFRQSRDALAFTQKWQRQENFPVRKKKPSDPPKDVGKMAHELSQSDGLCDWWNDYHYGYNHADTSPWYIVAMADYVRTSGDVEFLKRSWPSVKQAYDWCLSKDSDNDGLMDLKGAGLGALEFGKLVGIYADVYTCGVFVQAIKEMKYMAELAGDTVQARQAAVQFKKARPRLEKLFWLDEEGFYAYGATDKGEQVHEKTPWSGVAMMFGLLDEERSAKSIEAFNSADMCTDWGVRSLSNKSELFDPTNYNYGAVWPFISSFFNTAQFKHHFGLPGYQILRSNIQHVFDHALGVVPEVFSGEMNEKLGEGYHHQGFSTTGYLLPFIRGLVGTEVDKVRNIVSLRPALPATWDHVELRHIWVGGHDNSFRLSQSDTAMTLSVAGDSTPCSVRFLPRLPLGQIASSVTKNGVQYMPLTGTRVVMPSEAGVMEPYDADEDILPTSLRSGDNLQVRFWPGCPITLPESQFVVGRVNSSVRIIKETPFNTKWDKCKLVLEGLAGDTVELVIKSPDKIKSIEGGVLHGDRISVMFDRRQVREFVRKEIVITLK